MSRRRWFVLLLAVLVTVVIVLKRFSGAESSDWPHLNEFDNETKYSIKQIIYQEVCELCFLSKVILLKI